MRFESRIEYSMRRFSFDKEIPMPELRRDPVIDRWVIIAAERNRRPNDFVSEAEPLPTGFDPFAPGNEDKTPPELAQRGRAVDSPPNSPGWKVRVVANKFPALTQDGELDRQGLGMFDKMNGIGAHEVVIENPALDWDFADASPEEARDILEIYIERMDVLRCDPRFLHTLVFRNVGIAAGASLAHPHSQIISVPVIPAQIKDVLDASHTYFAQKERCVFCDIVRQETSMRDRVVEENDLFVVLSPYAARFPFELQIYPRRHCHDFSQMTPDEIGSLSEILPCSLKRISEALGKPAYNMIVQTAPHAAPHSLTDDYWSTVPQSFHWRIDILPRLTKIAGFEWGTGFYINPISPESATEYLREAV